MLYSAHLQVEGGMKAKFYCTLFCFYVKYQNRFFGRTNVVQTFVKESPNIKDLEIALGLQF